VRRRFLLPEFVSVSKRSLPAVPAEANRGQGTAAARKRAGLIVKNHGMELIFFFFFLG
jgi:hypothetical protein